MKTIRILIPIITVLIIASNHLIADINAITSLPRYKNQVKPLYPEEARKAGKEGRVALQATIGVNGLPQNIIAITQLGFGFEEAAIEALKKTTFHPANKERQTCECYSKDTLRI